jgi:hypothetical protein
MPDLAELALRWFRHYGIDPRHYENYISACFPQLKQYGCRLPYNEEFIEEEEDGDRASLLLHERILARVEARGGRFADGRSVDDFDPDYLRLWPCAADGAMTDAEYFSDMGLAKAQPTVPELEACVANLGAEIALNDAERKGLKAARKQAHQERKAAQKQLNEIRAGTGDAPVEDLQTVDDVTAQATFDGANHLIFTVPRGKHAADTFPKLARAYGQYYNLDIAALSLANAPPTGQDSEEKQKYLRQIGLRAHFENTKSRMAGGTCVLTGLTTAEANRRMKQFEDKCKLQEVKGGGGARHDAGPYANAPPPPEGCAHDGTTIPPVAVGRNKEAEAEGDFVPYCTNATLAPKASDTAETCAIDTYNSALGVRGYVTKGALNDAGKRNNGGALARGGGDINALQGPPSFNALHRYTLVLKPGTCNKSKKKKTGAASFAELLQCENKILFCSIMIGVGKQHKHHFGVDGNRAGGIGLVYDNGCNGRLIAYDRADDAGDPNDPTVQATALKFFTDVLQLKNPQHPTAHRLMIHKSKLADTGLRYTSPYK